MRPETSPLLLLLLASCAGPGVPSRTDSPIAFLSMRDGNFEVYLLPTPDAEPVNLTRHPASDFGCSWSPDGTQLAFCTDRDGNQELYVMEADGSNPRNLTRHTAEDKQPAWSPDGANIAFISTRDHARGEVYVMRSDGTGVRRLTHNENYEEVPAWSPDGESIAFCRLLDGSGEEPDNGELFLMDADGGRQRRLTHRTGFDSAPNWSPDGSLIAFHGTTEEGADIFTIAPDKSGLANLTGGDQEYWQPCWSANGAEIVYCAGTGPHAYDIWIMDADGSNRRRLTTHPDRDESPMWLR